MKLSLRFYNKTNFLCNINIDTIPYFMYSCFEGRERSRAQRYKNWVYMQKLRNIGGKGHEYVILMHIIDKWCPHEVITNIF
jgi:hypothetical protein